MDSTASFIIGCDAEAATELRRALGETGASIEDSPTHGLDGEQAAQWVLIATVAIQTAPAVLDSLKGFLSRKKVSSVTVGDVTIENPRPEDLERLLARPPK